MAATNQELKFKVQFLEAKIAALLNENCQLRSLLQQQKISENKMSKMIAKMDGLLEQKELEIETLTHQLLITSPSLEPDVAADQETMRSIPCENSDNTARTFDNDQAKGLEEDNITLKNIEEDLAVSTEHYRSDEERLGHKQKSIIRALRGRFYSGASDGKRDGKRNHLFWKFLMGLLLRRDQKCIKWTGDDWEFYLADHKEVARLWGAHRRNPNMTYNTMTCALRYCYSKDILKKSGGNFTYRFVEKFIVSLL